MREAYEGQSLWLSKHYLAHKQKLIRSNEHSAEGLFPQAASMKNYAHPSLGKVLMFI